MNKFELMADGERALDSLIVAKKEINKAKNWGVVDILGGGFLISMIKRSKISNAKHLISLAQRDLNNFTSELRQAATINLDLGIFLDIGDFFESFIADVWIQSKLNKAGKQLDEAIYKLEKIIADIRSGVLNIKYL